jgi:hypothetical protein
MDLPSRTHQHHIFKRQLALVPASTLPLDLGSIRKPPATQHKQLILSHQQLAQLDSLLDE